ncbi:MAG: flagellar assembly protein FliH [Spirochaetaceae bacterium]|nr:MAG: flagellar assembly protein FliH [Spirochaetaceae bacterium]
MAKNVFRSGEVKVLDGKIFIEGPQAPQPIETLDEVADIEEYSGPTADDLRREAEQFKQNWDAEREKMIDEARQAANQITEEAENRAFDEVKRRTAEAQEIKQQAEQESERLVAEAKQQADKIVADAEARATEVEQDAYQRGLEQGEAKGFDSGKAEVSRLIDRLHVIIDKAIARRNEIIEESESQLIHLVLGIAAKVVKVISENQKNVVVNNMVQALRKLKTKSDVIVRVNLQDLEMATDHVKEVIEMVERVGNVSVAEDTTVDPGGCIIETDFGRIDARISSQLREIEDRILEITPIQSRAKLKE